MAQKEYKLFPNGDAMVGKRPVENRILLNVPEEVIITPMYDLENNFEYWHVNVDDGDI